MVMHVIDAGMAPMMAAVMDAVMDAVHRRREEDNTGNNTMATLISANHMHAPM